MGKLPPGAYDMAREFRILKRLVEVFPLAPRGLHLCDEPSVLGAPFQITRHRGASVVGMMSPMASRGSDARPVRHPCFADLAALL
jgi:Predicted aminoglycoside phosphotransferase